ncbi:hypothetical protein ONZ51_g4498 [Trametes cubensis]|uniref:Uncharacterized protein n=1 Tax=Trametes cubensis TaxID=1111947 RepID=A0AAD7XA86_9APHY|nr:hypothetical protein ONZ51_g4498 [Trametes cubensis]
MSSTSTPVPKTINSDVIILTLGAMNSSNGMFNSALEQLQKHGKQVKEMCPTLEGVSDQIKHLSGKVEAQDAQRKEQVEDICTQIKGKYKSEALARMTQFIQKRIKDEVSRQVDVEMKKQMYPNHLHRPLQEDVDEGRAQVIAMKAALANSEARRKNATMTWENTTEPLAPIARSDGEKSTVWPTDANSLMAYDDATMAQLLRDYELQDHRDRTRNFNRFMAFIGSPMRQVFSPTAGDAPIGTRGS